MKNLHQAPLHNTVTSEQSIRFLRQHLIEELHHLRLAEKTHIQGIQRKIEWYTQTLHTKHSPH